MVSAALCVLLGCAVDPADALPPSDASLVHADEGKTALLFMDVALVVAFVFTASVVLVVFAYDPDQRLHVFRNPSAFELLALVGKRLNVNRLRSTPVSSREEMNNNIRRIRTSLVNGRPLPLGEESPEQLVVDTQAFQQNEHCRLAKVNFPAKKTSLALENGEIWEGGSKWSVEASLLTSSTDNDEYITDVANRTCALFAGGHAVRLKVDGEHGCNFVEGPSLGEPKTHTCKPGVVTVTTTITPWDSSIPPQTWTRFFPVPRR